MERLTQWIEIVLAVLGLVSVVAGFAAKWLPPGKAKDIARDLGMRAGDAIGVLAPKAPEPKDGAK
jgi:hypothetical protein